MAKTLPLLLDGVHFEVTTVQVPGTELTGATDKAVDAAAHAYETAKAAVVALATDFAATVREMSEATRPREVTMRFGVAFTSQGNVLILNASASSTIELSLVFDT